MKRLTESYESGFRIIGSDTVYPVNPLKSQKVGTALAKLFQLEEMSADYEQHREYCSACDTEFPVPDNLEYKYCPVCGKKRQK